MGSTASVSRSTDISTLDVLTDLALDLRWSYHHSADHLWQMLDADLWDLTHNPWVVLQTISQDRLKTLSNDPGLQALLANIREKKQAFEQSQTWFQRTHPRPTISSVAYFSMEFMLSEALPIYSGGLGNVAGDQLKTASSLGVPVTGVSLLYQQGYFRQEIDAQGQQLALYPFNDPGQLPITPVREANGEWLRVSLDFPGGKLWIRTWQARIGRARLYLLDTNDLANIPAYRGITSELYGGGPELRLKQEMVLGIGGWRLLKALGIAAEVCHLNEGHAAFAVLERARSYMAERKLPFDLALATTRAGNLFTTHTPVDAGFDRFHPGLMEWYFKHYAEKELSISVQDVLALGRRDPNDSSEAFNMAYLALHGSGAVNGVSRLHGQVSRKIFQSLFPRWPENEVPITYVTNGVHASTWDSAPADSLWETACGKDRWHDDTSGLEKDFRGVSDADLWQLRAESRKTVVDYVRKHYTRQLAGRGVSGEELEQAGQILDADTLTLGFARRFASYKRPNLLLHDPDRLTGILTNRAQPVQLILAGKAHPQDGEGQSMIRQWFDFLGRLDVRSHVVFLSDYDLLMAEHLVQGVDLWINTPRRPWEASGTSGMKVLVNGGLNLSELDGWWAEAYTPEVGWALGDGREHNDDAGWDAYEAETLYALLEQQIIPEFYNRDQRGIPRAWVSKMRESMARLTPEFSANRVVRQYTEDYYLSTAAAYKDRTAKDGALGSQLLKWQQHLAKHWGALRFGSATAETKDGQYQFQVQVFLDDLDPEAVSAEIYAEEKNDDPLERHMMTRGARLVGAENGFTYSASVPVTRSVADYTPRLVPQQSGALIPIEAPYILWHESPSWR